MTTDNRLPTTPGSPLDEFKQKCMDRLREGFGEIVPDSVLRQMAEETIRDTFLKPTRVEERKSSWPHDVTSTYQSSWFVQAVVKEAQPLLEKEVKAWVASNQDVLKKALSEFLTQQNLLLLVMAMLKTDFEVQFQPMRDALINIQSRLT